MVKPEKFGHLHLIYLFTVPLSKAFDLVDHTIKKLELCGVKVNSLSNRKQFISLNDKNASLEKNRCGVPQGFIDHYCSLYLSTI